eukprot:2263614-Pleurochrysis_carterae.AAC.4
MRAWVPAGEAALARSWFAPEALVKPARCIKRLRCARSLAALACCAFRKPLSKAFSYRSCSRVARLARASSCTRACCPPTSVPWGHTARACGAKVRLLDAGFTHVACAACAAAVTPVRAVVRRRRGHPRAADHPNRSGR